MSWTLKFWSSSAPIVTWNYGTRPAPSDLPTGQASSISSYISSIAGASTLAASRLNAFGQDIRFGYSSGEVGHAYAGGGIDAYVLIDVSAASTIYFFNTEGKLVAGDVRLTIMHELAHIYLSANDPNNGFLPSQSTMNGANYDFRGPVVDEQNAIADNAGLTSQIQTSYFAAMSSADPIFSSFNANVSYSDGRPVDTARFGTSGDDTIDHSNNTVRTRDLLFGLEGDDTIKGGIGDDSLYGGNGISTDTGSGNDKLYGGDGGDRLYGGDGNDFLDSGLNIVDEEVDLYGDKLDGGAGNDVLILRGLWIEEAKGGTGNDAFWIDGATAGGSYLIADSDPGDTLYWKGYQLLGGTKEVIEFIWPGSPSFDASWDIGAVDSHGIRYHLFGNELSIDLPDGSGIMIQNFADGDFGIHVGAAIDEDDLTLIWNDETQTVEYHTSLALSSIALDGQEYNYDDLSGYASALASAGPNTLPTTYIVP